MKKRDFPRRSIAFLLALVMLLGMMPKQVFAAVDLKPWNKSSSNVVNDHWDLPPQATFRTDYNDGIQYTGARFIGHFTDTSGRTVLKGVYTKQQYHAEDWKYVSFKFDKELFDMIDFEDSFMLDAAQKPNYKFKKPTYPGASDTEMVVPFYNYDSWSNIKNVNFEFYLTLKPGITWEKVMEHGSHKVQMRTYNQDASKVYTMSRRNNPGPYTDDNYTSYTQSFAITDIIERQKDYMYQIQPKRDNRVKVSGAEIFFKPEENKVLVVYQYLKSTFTTGETQHKAFYQYIYPDLMKYIVPDENGVIGTLSIRNDSFERINHSSEISHDVAITTEDLNKEADGGATIIIAEEGFQSSNNLKIKRVPQDVYNLYIYPNAAPADSDYTVIEYNVDTNKIRKDIVNNNYAVLPLTYSSMYLEDGKSQAYWQAEVNDNEKVNDKYGLNVPAGTMITFATGTMFNTDKRAVNIQFGDNKALDFIYNVSPSDTSGQLKYYVAKDFFIPKGTEVRLVNPSGDLERRFQLITMEFHFPDKPLKKLNLRKSTESTLFNNYILSNSDVIGSAHIKMNVRPVIDEIFSDTGTITGLLEETNSWVNAEYAPDQSTARVFAYDKEIHVPDDAKSDERFAIKQANSQVLKEKKNYSGSEFEGYSFELKNDKELVKDTPIVFTAKNPNNIPSIPVVEQVQAKVTFDLMGQTSKIDGKNTIEKIAPLNKEYPYVKPKDPTDPNKTLDNYVENPNYKPSGFGKIENAELKNTENLKVDSKKSTVTVTQNLTDKAGNKSTLNRNVINYIDHNGKNYQIQSKDAKIQAEEVDKLLKRQFPIDEEVNLPNAKRIIGWTTVKLEDKVVGGQTVTAEKQYYELLNSKGADEKPNRIVRNLSDWEEARKKAYVYDEESPLEKNETVYAVYGGLSLILHSGINDENGNEITVSLPIEPKDIEYTDAKTKELDGTTSATMIIKEMPKAPYTGAKEDIKNADERLKDFKKDGETFVGWTILKDQNRFRAGYNNDRINELVNGIAKINGQDKKILKETEGLNYLIREMKNPGNRYYSMAIPNGFNLAISSKDFDQQGNFNTDDITGLKTRDQLLNNVSEIHLYAVYRPFFTVTVDPQYKLVDKNQGQYGEYVDVITDSSGTVIKRIPEESKNPLQIGLMTRTAVTPFSAPTVDASANYNPIGDRSTLKKWTPNGESPEWELPGYDALGRRKSYVSVVVPEGKEEKYEKFNKPFTDQSWKELGISTYFKWVGESKDPQAPKNLYRDNDPTRDPYGVALAKSQSFTVNNGTTIDAFTSATARKSLLNNKYEVTGYNIAMTNSLDELPTPKFDKVKTTDNQVKLEWKDMADYMRIDKIVFYLDGAEYILTKSQEGTFSDGNLVAQVSGTQLVLTGLDLSEKGGKDLKARYFEGEKFGEIGSTRIIANRPSEPVTKMGQVIKQNPNEALSIKFTVPEKPLYQVGQESKYIAEKWTGTEWVKVGEKVLTEADKIHDAYQGNEYVIPLVQNAENENFPNKVNHGDIIRIVSYERNIDAEYTESEKTADPALENGYSMPAYSTGDKTSAPKPGHEKVQYVTLDLTGPTGDIKATDERFRRFVNIEGMLSEIPDNQQVILRFNDGRDDITFETREMAVAYLNQLIRYEEMPEMTIVAKDRYGNVGETEVKYTKTYQLQIFVTDAKPTKKYVNVSSDIAGATIEATVYRGMEKVASGTQKVIHENESKRLLLTDSNSNMYRLQKGDRIHFEGTAVKDGNTHTANPFDVFVK